MPDVTAQVLSRPWFYRFELPGGQCTESYLPAEAQAVHSTRLAMLDSCLQALFSGAWSGLRAIDLACHEGFFSAHLAKLGVAEIIGIDARQSHVDDAMLMARALGNSAFTGHCADLFDIGPERWGSFDIVLNLGLIYHLENPVGALRISRALTRRVCLVETQVAPNLSGPLDWGHYEFVKPMQGSFAVIDETEETHGPEMSTAGICLAPSVEALLWIMRKVGFDRVELLKPPENSYEQHRFGKRVMVAGYVDATG